MIASTRNAAIPGQRKAHWSGLAIALQLPLLILVIGIVISGYPFLVKQLTVHVSGEDCVAQAASAVGQRIAAISVDDAVFGSVGIGDVADSLGTRRVTSLNRIYATLLLDARIAQDLHLPYLQMLVHRDFQRAQQIERQLSARLKEALGSAPGQDHANAPLIDLANQIVTGARVPNETLVSVQMKLGRPSEQLFDSGMNAVAGTPASLVARGHYRGDALIAAASPGDFAHFYQLAPSTRLIAPRGLDTTEAGALPPCVLVQASFRSNSGQGKIRTRTACVMVGGIVDAAPPAVLMVSFPQGAPANLRSMMQVMTTCQPRTSGIWQQAIDGEVPGKGKLASASSVALDKATAGDAVQEAFYHWLRAQATQVSTAKLIAMLAWDWTASASVMPASSEATFDPSAPNSALTKDTGSRAFAFSNLSSAGTAGQAALRSAFSGKTNAANFPASSLPIIVDADGNCHIAGGYGLDEITVKQFLDALYATNLAGYSSYQIADNVVTRMNSAIEASEREIRLTGEELEATSARFARAIYGEPQGERSPVARSLRSAHDQLRAELDALRQKEYEYQRIQKRAKLARDNARAAARQTFELCANLNTRARRGLVRINSERPCFMLGDLTFYPLTTAVTEQDIYARSDRSEHCPWLDSALSIISKTRPPQTSPAAANNEMRTPAAARPLFVLFDSRELAGTRTPTPVLLADSPFASSGVSPGQAAFYAQDAIITGSSPKVAWSVLVRDMLAAGGFSPAALPVSEKRWCSSEQFDMSPCPGLGVEVQIRAPVPSIPDLPVGSMLRDPTTSEHVSQLPPMPPSML